jgi:hypothetical protein
MNRCGGWCRKRPAWMCWACAPLSNRCARWIKRRRAARRCIKPPWPVGVGRPQGALLRGAALGLAAGLGAVFLPGPLGLGEAPSNRTPATTAMTIGWYLIGGLAAALAYRTMAGEQTQRSTRW